MRYTERGARPAGRTSQATPPHHCVRRPSRLALRARLPNLPAPSLALARALALVLVHLTVLARRSLSVVAPVRPTLVQWLACARGGSLNRPQPQDAVLAPRDQSVAPSPAAAAAAANTLAAAAMGVQRMPG